MKRSTRWMIFIVYYVSKLLGLLSFSYRHDTHKLETNIFITFYSFVINLLMFSAVPLFWRIQWKPRNGNGPELHFKITSVICLMHLAVALIAVALYWTKRNHFIITIRDFQHLRDNFMKKFKMSEKVKIYYENSIRSKFYWGLISTIIATIVAYDSLRNIFVDSSYIVITGLCILDIVLNITMLHYFFAFLNINALLAVVNEDVERILNTSSVLFQLQRLKKIKVGALTTACCKLADELDDLAVQHYKLQLIGERINRMYDLLGACIVLTLYMHNMNVIYMGYMIIQHEALSQQYGVVMVMVVLPISLFFYYKDLKIFLENILNFGDFVKKTETLLNRYQIWLPTLDVRVENSLKNFSIQLAMLPFERKLLGLFEFNRYMVFATVGSTVSNAIVLMQYDYKYSKY